MSNNKCQKVPRKSKLIPREYLDDVQDVIQMQADDKESVLQKDPNPVPGTSFYRVPALVPFTVKVEVEEFVEKPSNDTTNKDFDAEEALAAVNVIKQEMRDFDECINSNKTTSISKKKDYTRCPRPKLPVPKRDSKPADIRICKLDPKVVFEELENLAKTTTSLADKILDIEIRNTWGRYLYEESEESTVNFFILNSLDVWQTWCCVSVNRESPLMYKCYICEKAWWYLQPLRDHIGIYHKDGNIKLHLEFCGHECNLIIAYNAGAPESPKTFPIDDPCGKCENNAFFHNNSKNLSYYQCKYCEHYNSTCRQLNDHLAICPKYMTHLKGANQEHGEFFKCHICGTVKVTINDLKEHYSNCHTVRSDVPGGFRAKQCSSCNQRYVHISFHWCPKKKFHSLCTCCMRRFPSKLIASLHTANSTVNYRCRVCEKILSNQCQEVKHMVISHSENFLMLPKCLTCVEHVVFSHDTCRNTHVVARHKKRYDKRLFGLETVVPKNCVSFDFEKFDSTSDDGDELSNTVIMSQSDDTASEEFSNNDYSVSRIIVKEVYSNFIHETNSETGISKRLQLKDSAGASTTKDVKPITFRDIYGNKYDHESTNSVEEENDLDVKTSIPEVQPTTNPVFYASQKVFPAIIKSEPLDTEELNENIVIKNEIIDEEETRVNEHTSLNEYISVKKDFSVQEYNMSDRVNEHTIVNIDHKKLDYEDLLARMFGVKKTDTDTSIVKQEPEEEIFAEEIGEDEQFVDDLIICNSQDNTDEVSDKEDDDESVEMSDELSSDDEVPKNSKVCKKCKFVGNKADFKNHLEFCSDPLKCTKCNHNYATMKSYVKHFHEKHKYARNTCPDCENVLGNNCTFVNHIKSHVHQSFSKVRSLKTTDTETKVVCLNKCKKCKENVVAKRLFDHWEAHLIITNRTSQLKNTPSSSSTDENEGEKMEVNKAEQFRAKVLSEAAVKDLIDRLLRKPESHWKGKSTCSICKKSLDRKHNFRRHLIEHLLTNALHNFERYNCLKCQVCAAKFWKSDVYKEHMREHACLPLYKCELCSKAFSDSSNFSKHKKIHNLGTMHCVVCKKKFRDAGQLKKHVQLHDTIGPIKCDCCSKVFLDETVYRRHQRIVKQKQNPVFHCRICKTKFTSVKMKWDHQWEVHKVRDHQADCPLCLKPFRKYNDVKQHLYKFHRQEMSIKEIRNLYEQAISNCKARRPAGKSQKCCVNKLRNG